MARLRPAPSSPKRRQSLSRKKEPHDQQRRHGAKAFTAEPAAAPLAKGFQRAFGAAKVEGGGQQPSDGQSIGNRVENKGDPTGDAGIAEAKEGQQAKAQTREGGEENNGWCRMHQVDPPEDWPEA